MPDASTADRITGATTGAEVVVSSLVDAGVSVCFANPGTSEMHFVSALDRVPGMRSILCLFEGVATGAADGYARMTGSPAATLLHLGPGLANGLANLHNAKRAHSPIVNVVGDHATDHKPLDAPLESDIDALAGSVSVTTITPCGPDDVAEGVASAVHAARTRRGVATLILRADVSWNHVTAPTNSTDNTRTPEAAEVDHEALATFLGPTCAIVAGGVALTVEGLDLLDRIATSTGARVFAETFPARLTRGAGVAPIERLGYFAEQATAQLEGVETVVLVDAAEPVSFFAYPGRPSRLVPPDAMVVGLPSGPDALRVLRQLAEEVAAGTAPRRSDATPRPEPSGELTAASLAEAVATALPEGAVISDEANTSGAFVAAATAGAPRHDVLTLTGGAIGQGLPVAIGAAVACPDRPVLALQADGSAMYTIQSLWTMVREDLDVTVLALNNGSYAILELELARVGATAGPQAKRLLDLSDPGLNLSTLARGMGMPATTVTTADALVVELRKAFASSGPHLIEAIVPPLA